MWIVLAIAVALFVLWVGALQLCWRRGRKVWFALVTVVSTVLTAMFLFLLLIWFTSVIGSPIEGEDQAERVATNRENFLVLFGLWAAGIAFLSLVSLVVGLLTKAPTLPPPPNGQPPAPRPEAASS